MLRSFAARLRWVDSIQIVQKWGGGLHMIEKERGKGEREMGR
jgi:hypothetical protein